MINISKAELLAFNPNFIIHLVCNGSKYFAWCNDGKVYAADV